MEEGWDEMKPETYIKRNFGKLKWYVLVHDFNSGEFVEENIFRDDLMQDIIKLVRKPYTFEDLYEVVNRWAMYHYWSKAEWEMVVTDLFGRDEKKIDVYDQLKLNLTHLVEYIARELKLEVE